MLSFETMRKAFLYIILNCWIPKILQSMNSSWLMCNQTITSLLHHMIFHDSVIKSYVYNYYIFVTLVITVALYTSLQAIKYNKL